MTPAGGFKFQGIKISTFLVLTGRLNHMVWYWNLKLTATQSLLPTLRFPCPIGLLWNPLPRVKKLLGGWPKIGLLFIWLPVAALFSSNIPISCQFREILQPFQCPTIFFSSISRIKRSWRAVYIDYPIHVEGNNLIVFLPNCVVFYYFKSEKHLN